MHEVNIVPAGMPALDPPVRVCIMGASGRMGQILTRLFSESVRYQVVARVDRREDGLAPSVISELSAAPYFDILVDYSVADATRGAISEMRRRKAAWLVGTTGLDDHDRDEIFALSAHAPILIASNTSLGIALMQRLCANATAALIDWDCEILETHHHSKLDAPSGTALSIARTIADARKSCGRDTHILTDRSAVREKRDRDSLGIASLRGGTVAGEHSAIWFGENERLEIRHIAESREIFARGALRVAHWLAGQKPGVFCMDDFLDAVL
ncbi:MAG: 4-hydroxy-tetrahydrodipicolinate reductase [Proteobacteria bacterium]|nr:4-hydroxy-tetrahydrodipicolinate reductase [Pseudomonadota bacterium]